MSTHKGLGGNHQLPTNPSWIEITRSDADPSQWPTNTTRVVDHEGHVNFMRPCELDESWSIGWRRGLGKNLAKKLGMPDGPDYVLKAWPAGYQMYDHNKGPQDAPRHDAYLIGSRNVKRFRSVPEFLPHALWLMRDPDLNRANCQCKYCGKTPQRIVSESFGLSPRASGSLAHSQSPSPTGKISRPPRPKAQKDGETKVRFMPYTAIRKAPTSQRAKSPEPRQSMSRDRANDLAAAYSGIEPKRQYRKGELVWCALDPPIWGKSEMSSIYYWPGILEDAKVKTKAVHSDQSNGANGSHPGLPPAAEPLPPPLWHVEQWFEYKVNLVGIAQQLMTREEMILPYQAYFVPDDLMHAVNDTPLANLDLTSDGLQTFNPCPPNAAQERVLFESAVAPYSLALQISSSLTNFWTPTDEWDLAMEVPPFESPASPWPTWPPVESVSAPANLSQDDLQALNTRMHGQGNVSPTKPYTQTCYQGLWWGPERIWLGDLVRLKIARQQIAPRGTDKIAPPSGPGPDTLRHLAENGRDMDDSTLVEVTKGACHRGLIMKLESLFMAEVPLGGGKTKKEARACGMLYEIADADWEEESYSPSIGKGKGKGKAKEVEDEPIDMSPEGQSASAYMPGPSPLKPPPLPNPDPSVPLEDTAVSVLSETVTSLSIEGQAGNPREYFPDGQVQPPLIQASYPPPVPPIGYKFRPILPPGYQAVTTLALVAGRYYPRITRHHQAQVTMVRVRETSDDLEYVNGLASLECISPGYYNAVEPVEWRPNRAVMLKDADAKGRSDTWTRWKAKSEEAGNAMAVDS